nr:hypothetical protein [Tanacetum cinerariifolium]
CQSIAQKIDFSGSDQIQTPQYPNVHPPSQETSDKVFQANHYVQNEESFENHSNKIDVLNSNKENEEPPQDSKIHQLIEECSTEIYEEQKQIATVLSTKEPEHLLSMGYEHLSITPETESDEVTESNAENHLPIPRECEVTLEDKRKYIKYVEASLPDPEIISVEEENGVEEENVAHQEEEESDNSLLDNFSPEFEIFCDHTEETRSGNTTHADNSLPEYDSFCFEIEPDQEMLINLMKNDIPDDPSNNSLLEEADLFLASDNLIPSGIENLLMTQKDNPSVLRPPLEPPYAEIDTGEEIPVVMNDKIE